MTFDPRSGSLCKVLSEQLVPTFHPSLTTDDLPSVLSKLERLPVPSISLPDKITTIDYVAAMALCGDTVVIALANYRVVTASFFPEPSEATAIPTQSPHMDQITHLVAAADGKTCVTTCKDGTLKVWDVMDRADLGTLRSHGKAAMWAALTIDSKLCVSVGNDGRIRLWSLESFTELANDELDATMVELAPDGNLCVCAAKDNSLVLWSIWDRKTAAVLPGHTSAIKSIAILHDGNSAFTGAEDGTLKKWDLVRHCETATLAGHKDRIYKLTISPDDKFCVSASGDYTVKVWTTADLREYATFAGHMYWVFHVIVTSDSRYCISTSRDFNLKLWSIYDKCEVASFQRHSSGVLFAAVTADGKHCVSGSWDKTVKMWSLVKRFEVPIIEHEKMVRSMAISRKFAASGSEDAKVKVWSCEQQREIATFSGHQGVVSCVAITPDDQYLISSCWKSDTNLLVWSLSTMQIVASLQGHTDSVNSVVVVNNLCVTSSNDRTIRVWSLISWTEVECQTNDAWAVLTLAPNGQRLISKSDKTIKLWNVSPLRLEATFQGHSEYVTAVAVTKDTNYLCSGSHDNTVKLWDLLTLSELATFTGHTDYVKVIALTPDDKHCISGSSDKSIKVWDIAQHRAVATLKGHNGCVHCLAITSDGELCISGDIGEGLLIVWSLRQFRRVATLARDSGVARSVFLCPNDQFCVAQIGNGRLLHYSLSTVRRNPEPLVSTPCEAIAYIQSLREGLPLCKSAAMFEFPSHIFNSLHVSAHFSHADVCERYMSLGVPIIRGAFGSPLTISLRHHDVKCVDVILHHLISLAKGSHSDEYWPLFEAVNEDILELLGSGASLVSGFFAVLMQPPDIYVEKFIAPERPMNRHFELRYFEAERFSSAVYQQEDVKLVVFCICFLQFNLLSGSEASIRLLTALSECEDRTVLNTAFVSTIIGEKWSNCYLFTLGVTSAYAALLALIVLCTFSSEIVQQVTIPLLCINSFFLLYELLQIFVLRRNYFKDLWNYIDLSRCALTIGWVCAGAAPSTDSIFSLCVVMLNFLRGFTYFRCFSQTRIFVYLTIAVVKDMYSFLLVLGYSMFSFGVFFSVLDEATFFGTMADGFNLVMGNFDNSGYGRVQWIVFIAAGLINVVIMMNLLISILGEAYGKTQLSLAENDLYLQLSLILEYEHLLFWRRTAGRPTFLATCKEAKDISEREEWAEKVVEITDELRQHSKSIENNANIVKLQVESDSAEVKKNMSAFDQRLSGMEMRMAGVEGKLDTILSLLQSQHRT